MSELPSNPPDLTETYKFSDKDGKTVIRGSDGAVIPVGQDTQDSRQFARWRQFSIPTPADPPAIVLPIDKISSVQYPADTLDTIIGLLTTSGGRPLTMADFPPSIQAAFISRAAIRNGQKGP